jgi:hypothetical protein
MIRERLWFGQACQGRKSQGQELTPFKGLLERGAIRYIVVNRLRYAGPAPPYAALIKTWIRTFGKLPSHACGPRF